MFFGFDPGLVFAEAGIILSRIRLPDSNKMLMGFEIFN